MSIAIYSTKQRASIDTRLLLRRSLVTRQSYLSGKILLPLIIGALTLISATAIAQNPANNSSINADLAKRKTVAVPAGKVMICHKTSDEKQVELTIDEHALNEHLSHNDYVGLCGTIDTANELQVMGCKNKDDLSERYLDNLIDAIRLHKAAQEQGGEPADKGITAGHLDLDTATEKYSHGNGRTNNHEHQWDDTHDLTTIDLFNIAGSGFDNIDRTFSIDQKFLITVVNSTLSTSAVIDINGERENVVDYQQRVKLMLTGDKPLTVYKLGILTENEQADGIVRLTSLKLSFDVNAIISGGLIPTNTACVARNIAGPNDEYRNGALLIQALNADSNSIHATLGYAQTGLLWETSAFWHWDPVECYGDANWQSVYDQCIADGSCLSPSKHSNKPDTILNVDKIYVCHKAGHSGKYVKIHISKAAACAHLGFVPDADGNDSGEACTPLGHQNGGDAFLASAIEHCPGVEEIDGADVSAVTAYYQNAVAECLDPKKGGGYLGGAKTQRINWKEILDNR